MEQYLRHTKDALGDLTRFTKVHGILGNEACDLDSTVSALVYGYYLHTIKQDETSLFLPILNIARGDFRLRTETTHFMSKVNLPTDLLTFRDEVNLSRLHHDGRLILTLVDHNVLPPKDSLIEDTVVMVIDHRTRERPDSSSVTVIMDNVGSCCTLVAEQLLNDQNFNMDEQAAILLYGTILVDTINRSPEAGKTTTRDEMMLTLLQEKLTNIDGQELFDELHAAKFDLSSLSNRELLEKDLKVIGNNNMTIAMSSVTMHLQDLLERPGFEEDMAEFCFSKGAHVVVIMTLSMKMGVERQLAVYSENRIFRQQIADLLDTSNSPGLQLDPTPTSTDSFLSFTQGNVQASRKKVIPILKTFLNGEATPRLDQQISPFDGLDSETLGSDAPLVNIKDSFSQEEQENFAGNMSQELAQTSFEPETIGFDDEFVPQELVQVSSDLAATGFDDTENVPQNLVKISSEGIETGLDESDPFGFFTSAPDPASGGSENPATTGSNVFMDDLDPFSALTSASNYSHNHSSGQTENNQPGNLLGAFDPFDFSAPDSKVVENSNPEDRNTGMDAFIDNLLDIGTSEDLAEVKGQVVTQDNSGSKYNPSSGQYSPVELSSEQASDAGSSYPVTPPNSYMEPSMDGSAKVPGLPSFNSSEIVKIMQEKKASLDYVDETYSLEDPDAESSLPFVPHSSFQESDFDLYAQEHDLEGSHDLPSFNSAEMVQRIHEKRASIGAETIHFMESPNDSRSEDNQPLPSEADTFPYTPQNSLIDSHMEKYKSQLVGLGETNLEHQVIEKRNSLEFVDFADLSTISESDQEIPTKSTGNVVAFNLAHEMKTSELDSGVFPEDAIEPDIVARAIAEEIALQKNAGEHSEDLTFDLQSAYEVTEKTSQDYTDIFVGRVEREPSVENFQEFLPEMERNVIAQHIASEMKAVASAADDISSQDIYSAADPFGFGDLTEESNRNLFQHDVEGMAEEIIHQNLEEVSRKGSDQISGPLFFDKHPSEEGKLVGEMEERKLGGAAQEGEENIENIVAEQIVSDMISNLSKMQELADQEENITSEKETVSGIDNPAFDTMDELDQDDGKNIDNVVATMIAREMQLEQVQPGLISLTENTEELFNTENLAKEIVANTYGRVSKEAERDFSAEVNDAVENDGDHFDAAPDDLGKDGFDQSRDTRNVVAGQIAEEMSTGVQFQNDVCDSVPEGAGGNGPNNGFSESDENNDSGGADAAVLVAQKFTDDIITEACEIVGKDGPRPPGPVSRNLSRSALARRMMEAEELVSDDDSGNDDSERDVENDSQTEDGFVGDGRAAAAESSFTVDDEAKHDTVSDDDAAKKITEDAVFKALNRVSVEEEDNLIAQRIAEAMQESGEDFSQLTEAGKAVCQDSPISKKKARFADDMLEKDEGASTKSPKKARFADEISQEISSETSTSTSSDDSLTNAGNLVKESSVENFQDFLPEESRNVIACRIAHEIMAENSSMQARHPDLHLAGLADGIENNDDNVLVNYELEHNGNEIDEGIGNEYLSPDREDVVREVASDLAKEIIEKALDSFPVEQFPLGDSQSESSVSSSDISPNSGSYPHPMISEISGDLRRSHEMCPVTVDSQEFELPLETEYLPNIDPLHGNLDLVTSPSKTLGTDASKEIAEDMGFKQLSAEIADADIRSSDANNVETVTSGAIELESKNRDILHDDSSQNLFEELPKQREITHPERSDRYSLTDGMESQSETTEYSDKFTNESQVETLGSRYIQAKSDSGDSCPSRDSVEVAKNIEITNLHSDEIEAIAEIHRTENANNVNLSTAIPETCNESGGENAAGSGHGEHFTVPSGGQTALTQRERKEVYMTTAGRISISMESTMDSMTGVDQQRAPAGDTIAEESHEQTTGAMPFAEMSAEGRTSDLTDEEFLSKKRGPSTVSSGEDTHDSLQKDDHAQMISHGMGSGVIAKETDLRVRRDSDSSDTLSRPDDTPSPVVSPAAEAIPEYSADEESQDTKQWRTVTIGDLEHTIDMQVIEPYKRVLSHGGYYGDGLNAVIVFSGCYLPDRSRKDYQYVMENLFYYVISTLDLLVAEDYMIVYFHGATPKRQMPSFSWLKRCYQMIDRRLKKNLKGLLLVHPTLWIKTVILMSRPFISSKFSSKLKMVKNLADLEKLVPMQHVFVPDQVKLYDDRRRKSSSVSTPSTPSSTPTSPH